MIRPWIAALAVLAQGASPDVAFRIVDVQTGWGVVYAVRVADVNADGRPDIVAINPTQMAWFENPSWQRHVIVDGVAPKDHVTIAAEDITGDGRVEIALGAGWNPRNTLSGGELFIATRSDPSGRQPWTLTPIGAEATLHRIRWATIAGRRSLVVTPLHGRGTSPPAWDGVGARIFTLTPPAPSAAEGPAPSAAEGPAPSAAEGPAPSAAEGPAPSAAEDPASRRAAWQVEFVSESRHILHNFLVTDFDGRPGDEIVTASREGLTLFTREPAGTWTPRLLAESAPGEVVLGRVAGRRVLATVEPWHGTSIVCYVESDGAWKRSVVHDGITGGHAVAWADFDGDGSDELVAGWRDGTIGLVRYRLDADGRVVARQTIDTAVAVEDVAVADLNGDGRPDLVAGGRSTGNIRLYTP